MSLTDLPGTRSLGTFLALQLVRYVAATQSFAMVVFHGGWILLALATWGHASAPDGAIGDASRAIGRAYAWLGGVDENGRGGEQGLMAVWGKLGFAIYLIEAIWYRLSGPREPMAWWRIAVASWLGAQLGYVLALMPTGDLGEATLVLIVFPILAGLATAWSIGAHRLGDLLVAHIRKQEGAPAAVAAGVGAGNRGPGRPPP